MLYESKDGSVQFDAYRVEAVHFTGEAFSGAPFSGAGEVDWLHEEIKAGLVSLVSGPDAAHATWAVNVGGGEAVLASPGDYVVKQVGSKTLYVCMGDLWELLTRPSTQVAESIGEVCNVLQSEVDEKAHGVLVANWMREAHAALAKDDQETDWHALHAVAVELYEVRDERGWRSGIDFAALVQKVERRVEAVRIDTKAEAVAKEHRGEFDPSEWNERVGALLDKPATAWQVNWQQLLDEVKDAIGEEVEIISLPRRTFYLYGVLSNMVTQAPDADDRYFRNVELWQEVIRDSYAMGEKFVAQVMQYRLPAGDVGDVIRVPTVSTITPSMVPPDSIAITDKDGNIHGTAHLGQAFQLEPRNYEERMGAWCDKVHREYLNLQPDTLRDWAAMAAEVEEIMGNRDPSSLPRAWLTAYGTVHAMGKQYGLMKPGPDEQASLMTAMTIGSTMANQYLGSEE